MLQFKQSLVEAQTEMIKNQNNESVLNENVSKNKTYLINNNTDSVQIYQP